MTLRKAVLAAAALALGPAALPRPAKAEATPHSWAVGTQGLGGLYGTDASVKYVLNDKSALELIASFTLAHSNQNIPLSGEFVTNSHSHTLFFDYIHKIAGTKDLTLSWLVEPFWGVQKIYSYSGTPGNTLTTTVVWGIGGGLDLEYFVLPNLSLGSKVELWGQIFPSTTDADNGAGVTTSTKSSSNQIGFNGQLLVVRCYFGGK